MYTMEDFNPAGSINTWGLVDGLPCAVGGFVLVTEDLALPTLQRNNAIRTALDRVGVYETALADPDKGASVIASADDATKALSLWRTPRPEDGSDDLTTWLAAKDVVLAAIEIDAQVPLADDPRPVPNVIPLWKAKAVLSILNLLDQANAIVAAADLTVQLYWHNATELHRNSPTLAILAPALGLTSAQIDDMFRKADAIVL